MVLDLRYEARDIDQDITSEAKIDQWFDSKTKGFSDLARAQLKKRWGTMKKVTSSLPRIREIVADILMDMETRDRLKSGRGNAMLVSDSVYAACRFFEAFSETELKGRCAIVKRRFVNEPGQMKLLIVVDKLLTSFDAPPATYLYIDKKMQDPWGWGFKDT